MSIAEGINSRIQKLAAEADALDAADSASETKPVTPLDGKGSGAESAVVSSPPDSTSPSSETTAALADPPPEQQTKHALLEEKLAAIRERRAAERLLHQAQERASSAERESKQAAEERAKWDALQKGTFKEAIQALGRDPREVFEEMAAEAQEAGKPETMIARARAEMERQLASTIEPLKKTIDSLQKQLEDERASSFEHGFIADFQTASQRPEFTELLIEYEPETLLQIAKTMRDNPPHMHQTAKRLNVQLTGRDGRFNMFDILNVCRAQLAQHVQGREARRSRLQAASTSQAAPQQAPANASTVNGTAEKRNAGVNTLGNQLASSRASDTAKPRLTREQRIQKLIGG